MRCPMCRTRLITLLRDEVEVDYCPSCEGLWLDGGELEAMAGQLRRANARGGGDGRDDDGDDESGGAGAEPDAGVLVWDAVFRRELRMLAPSELRRMSVDQTPAGDAWSVGPDNDDAETDLVPAATRAAAAARAAADGPRCPVCDGSLTVAVRHGIRLDVCSNCRGTWFDPGELEAVLARVGRDNADRR